MKKENVFAFISSKVGMPVGEETVFFTDTGVDGLDAEIFMEELQQEYNLDLAAYDATKYHLSEDELQKLMLTLYRLVFDRKKLLKYTFTGKHLLQVIQQQKWVDPF